jgi:glucose-1-phosphate cytidylyltransferase
MKVVILAGGHGTRLGEETMVKPKPMVEIGYHPILWHIMKIYSAYGLNDFIICLGYMGHMIRHYFANFFLHHSDVTFDLRTNTTIVHHSRIEPWRVTLVETGNDTMTGGRLKRVSEYIGDETFCLTYGDGVADLNIEDLIRFHREQKTLATLTAARSPGRFGAVLLEPGERTVASFHEKPDDERAWINGGFFVLEPGVMDYIEGDATVWEAEPLQQLARDRQLSAYPHSGFWQPMDTLRDKNYLEELWRSGKARWKVW